MDRRLPLLLIAEDEPAIAELLSDLLGGEGYEVEQVSQGGTALVRIQQGGVDLLLLDLTLPDISGFDVCRQLREQEKHTLAPLPILVLTADHREKTEQAILAAGASDLLTKPFDLNIILSRLQSLLLKYQLVPCRLYQPPMARRGNAASPYHPAERH